MSIVGRVIIYEHDLIAVAAVPELSLSQLPLFQSYLRGGAEWPLG